MIWMDIAAHAGMGVAKIASLWNKKMKLWVEGRKNLPERVASAIGKEDKVIWFHAASYGEFEEGRPLIETIRSRYPNYKILVTFFSPSGYEGHKNYKFADWVFYLPLDTQAQVSRFLDAVHPEIAVFVKYEFWPNLLAEMKKRQIRTFLVSARFIPNSAYFKWWGGVLRKALTAFETIFVQDVNSKNLLNNNGFHNAVVAGDPRFDRVKDISEISWREPLVEKFKNGQKLFIAGSTVEGKDDEVIQNLINSHPKTRFLVVPHEMDRLPMEKMVKATRNEVKIYSECNDETDFSNTQVLILDRIGMLSKLYRYGDWAFIGGGFVAGIHSVIEATVYGMPAAFGPNFAKNRPGIEMVQLGICASVNNAEELHDWFSELENNDEKLSVVSQKAREYTLANCGATSTILSQLFPN